MNETNNRETTEIAMGFNLYNEAKVKALLNVIACRAGCVADMKKEPGLGCPTPNLTCSDCWHEYLKVG